MLTFTLSHLPVLHLYASLKKIGAPDLKLNQVLSPSTQVLSILLTMGSNHDYPEDTPGGHQWRRSGSSKTILTTAMQSL